MDIALLNQYISEHYISVQKHPVADLYIYNYSPKTQYAGFWNDITMMCRGLIMNSEYRIMARPFRKFFNIEELQPETIPNEPFEVYEKIDGSLGILYWLDDKPFIATRGSFVSEQALKANEILYQKYAFTFHKIDKTRTWLFEIIYPGNRIVIDYGDTADLFLLAIIDTETGNDLPVVDIGFPVVKRYDGINDIAQLRLFQDENREGYVIKFRSGFRVKMKFAEYTRLHRLVTRTSSVSVWEHLSQNIPLDDILEHVPDEFYEWVRITVNELKTRYLEIENYCKANFRILDTRKETAFYFKTLKYYNVLFAMLDGRDYSPLIWKFIRPVYSRPFKVED